jgi:hypothetical protein
MRERPDQEKNYSLHHAVPLLGILCSNAGGGVSIIAIHQEGGKDITLMRRGQNALRQMTTSFLNQNAQFRDVNPVSHKNTP